MGLETCSLPKTPVGLTGSCLSPEEMGEVSRKQKLSRESLWAQVSLPRKRAGSISQSSEPGVW